MFLRCTVTSLVTLFNLVKNIGLDQQPLGADHLRQPAPGRVDLNGSITKVHALRAELRMAYPGFGYPASS